LEISSVPDQKVVIITPARVIAAVCVVLPFVAVLWVPFYNRTTPKVAGFPFFFWWQLLWVLITAFLMLLAYLVVRREELYRAARTVAPPPPSDATSGDTTIEGPSEGPENGDEESGE
jgi:hypothetical protein